MQSAKPLRGLLNSDLRKVRTLPKYNILETSETP
jgi:hypothetical protein